MHVRSKFFTVRQPKSCNAEGLYECFMRAFSYMHVTDWQNKLVGIGCDGANVNMDVNGLRGLIEASVPWVVTFWCLIVLSCPLRIHSMGHFFYHR